jgi:hypothetical protein
MLRIGRTVTPGWRMSIITKLMPACFFTVLSVRTSANMWVASKATLVQIFWPLMTNSSPSMRASVRRLARSEPALGSE